MNVLFPLCCRRAVGRVVLGEAVGVCSMSSTSFKVINYFPFKGKNNYNRTYFLDP